MQNSAYGKLFIIFTSILLACSSCARDHEGGSGKPSLGVAELEKTAADMRRLEDELSTAAGTRDGGNIDRILKELVPLQKRYYNATREKLLYELGLLTPEQKDKEIEIRKELSALTKEEEIKNLQRSLAENAKQKQGSRETGVPVSGTEAVAKDALLKNMADKLQMEINLERTVKLDQREKLKDLISGRQLEIYALEQKIASLQMDQAKRTLLAANPGNQDLFAKCLNAADRHYDFMYRMELARLERERDKLIIAGTYRNDGSEAWQMPGARLEYLESRTKNLKESIAGMHPEAIRTVYALVKENGLKDAESYMLKNWGALCR